MHHLQALKFRGQHSASSVRELLTNCLHPPLIRLPKRIRECSDSSFMYDQRLPILPSLPKSSRALEGLSFRVVEHDQSCNTY